MTLLAAACGSSGGTGDTGGGPTGGNTAGGGSAEPMKFGYVLPETGSLAYLGPPQIEAMKYAISLINKDGGVLGKEVPAPVGGDEADDQAIANQSADRVLAAGVNAIIGAAASGMSLAIIDKVTGAGVAQCSGSNTAPTFTDYKDNGLYFRTAPSDALQGPVLADTIISDGHSQVAITARADDYGKGLADATAKALQNGGATVVLNETYDPKATDFNAPVANIVAKKPDAVVIVAFEEGKQIIQGLIEAGLTPQKVGMYGADGLRNADLAKLVSPGDPSKLAGFKGTAPASADNPDFLKNLKAFAPSLKEVQFAPQVFDCVNILALAAEQAKSTDANDFKKVVNGITKDGEKCTSFADCKKLIDEGKDVDYDGASGPLDFTEAGEPGSASIEVYEFDKSGKLTTVKTVESKPAS
ncbi:MAG: ABC transporter substrate-binding protein [Intrasporangium sp.]|uniref:ABC transporter substrate-binding protein n=1 Tax=Intrasporangium sp. TaxID=1925024 RepID=UPI00264A07BD|nr:ABC transporter substrate-binding protein [Intrasporangium sp.]MDN5795677.1 ABC transporter substrate-binding protein [Intrasporangium sp.]